MTLTLNVGVVGSVNIGVSDVCVVGGKGLRNHTERVR